MNGSALFSARFEGVCDNCSEDFDEGDLIGYTFEGELACRECWHRQSDGNTTFTIDGDGEDPDDE